MSSPTPFRSCYMGCCCFSEQPELWLSIFKATMEREEGTRMTREQFKTRQSFLLLQFSNFSWINSVRIFCNTLVNSRGPQTSLLPTLASVLTTFFVVVHFQDSLLCQSKSASSPMLRFNLTINLPNWAVHYLQSFCFSSGKNTNGWCVNIVHNHRRADLFFHPLVIVNST